MIELPRIVRERLRAQASGRVDAHPDADLLTAFSERTLSAKERRQVMAHLALCADCRHAIALAAPPLETGATPLHRPHPSHGFGWAHWFALAASVVVVAAAVLQIPRARQGGMETELPPSTPVAQAPAGEKPAADQYDKLAGPTSAVNGSLAVRTEGTAESSDFRSYSGSLSKPEAKGDQPPPGLLDDGVRENKQQARAQQFAVAPRRDADLQVGAGGGRRPDAASGAVAGAASGGIVGGPAPSSTVGPRRSRVDAPATPPSAPPAAIQPPAKSAEEKLRAGEAGRPKDAELEKSELAAAGRDDRQQAAGKSAYLFEAREGAGQPAEQDTLAASRVTDEKSRKVAAAAEPSYQQPKELPMKKHPEPQVAATSESTVSGRLARKLKPPLRWSISSAGRVIRSLDGGQTWQDVAVAEGVRFRAVAAQDGTVWAGGDGGALFYSSDGGQSWVSRSLFALGFLSTETAPTAAPRAQPALGHDIVRIDVSPAGRVTVTTSQPKSFVSTDAGRSWKQQ